MDKYRMDGCKLSWHMDRVEKHFKKGERVYPLLIDIGVTKFCNAKCLYCFGIQQKMNGDMIPSDKLIQLFKDAPGLGIKAITVTGDGENTLNPAIYEAVEMGKRNGLDIGFATNGIALDEKKIACLIKNCVWLRYNLSAIGKENYKKIHGVDKWDVVKKNIETTIRLKKELKSNCTIGLQMVLIPSEIDQVIPESQFAIDVGVDYFVIKQYSHPNCKDMPNFDLNWYNNKETTDILKTAESMSNEATQIIPKMDTIENKGHKRYEHCPDCALLFQISGNSKCYPCGLLFNREEYCYGDLNKQSLKEILDSDRYWEVIRVMREEFDNKKECEGCACRHDASNRFISEYLNPPEHLNFI